MAAFQYETVSAADAANFNGAADTLTLSGADAALANVFYVAASGSAAEHVTIAFDGRSVDFGAGIYGDFNIRAADGSMLFVGGPGGEAVQSTPFRDGLYGGQGDDSMNGADGSDVLQGNQGGDLLIGGLGDDAIYGGQGNDTIRLGVPESPASEANWTNGNRGDDIIEGAVGADIILGGQGSDTMSGGGGNDLMVGNLGDDLVSGDAGDDRLIGEGGADILAGGPGSDLFIFQAGSSDAAASLIDRIVDWSPEDRIHVDGAASGYVEVETPTQAMGGGYGYDPPPAPDTSYGGMMARANEQLAMNPLVGIVAAHVGGDVVVFADTNGDRVADLAILLVGRSLADIGPSNIA